MTPELRVFKVEGGLVYEETVGTPRECFRVELTGGLTLHRLSQNLRRDHGPEVDVARNMDLDLDFIVSMRQDGKFTDNQVRKIVGVYKGMIRALPVKREAVILKGPWPQT
jgi:hypothetical protein